MSKFKEMYDIISANKEYKDDYEGIADFGKTLDPSYQTGFDKMNISWDSKLGELGNKTKRNTMFQDLTGNSQLLSSGPGNINNPNFLGNTFKRRGV